MPEADMTFESNYDVEILKELPSGGDLKRFYYPGSTSAGGRDGLLIKVTPAEQEADPWIGIFAFGLISPKGVSGVFSHPDPETICVVSRGVGYLVKAANPMKCQSIEVEPLLDVYPVITSRLLIFVDYIHLIAYGPEGLAWQTARLSWDGLEVTEIRGDRLRGKAWSSPENRYVDFTVDLRTGNHEGGARPPSTPTTKT